jgi:hypothetical protein
MAVVVQFDGDKMAHEHLYWDQASVLVQLGLLQPGGLPVVGGRRCPVRPRSEHTPKRADSSRQGPLIAEARFRPDRVGRNLARDRGRAAS